MTRELLLPLLLLAMPAKGLHAAPPQIDIPAEVRPAGQYATFTPTGGAIAIEYVGLDGVDPLPSAILKDARTFIIDTRGLKAGRYRFVAVGSGGTGELARAGFAVVVGDPGPGPGPTPPNPPQPDDPLLAAIRVPFVIENDPAKLTNAKKLAAVYRQATNTANDPALTTLGSLYTTVSTAARTMVPMPALQGVRVVIGAEFTTKLGSDPDKAMTPELRALCAQTFTRVAGVLEQLQ